MAVYLVKRHRCAYCGQLVEKLRDQLSVKEWHISHLCQECQDSVFKEESSLEVKSI